MSFQSDIYSIITTDPSLNAAVEGIKFENLSENYDITKDWVVYSFKKASQVDCLQDTAYSLYSIYIRIFSPDTIKLNALGDYIQNLIDDNSSGRIQDIEFISDEHNVDIDKKQYSIALEFSAIYV